MAVRNYSNTAVPVALTTGVGVDDTQVAVTSVASYPPVPFTAAIQRGTTDEEVVLVTGKDSGTNTFTVTRGFDGTPKNVHPEDAVFEHCSVALDFREANAVVSSPPNQVPIGAIIMWSGSVASIPHGYALCNGTNNTPDLRGKFILASTGETGNSPTGQTGGANQRTLTSAHLPRHTHVARSVSAGAHSHTGATTSNSHTHSGSTASDSHAHSGSSSSDFHNHSLNTTSTGSSHSHLGAYDLVARGSASNSNGSFGSGGDSHSHSISTNSDTHSHGFSTNSSSHSHDLTINAGGTHAHDVQVDPTGDGQPFDNRPAFFALAFIMHIGS